MNARRALLCALASVAVASCGKKPAPVASASGGARDAEPLAAGAAALGVNRLGGFPGAVCQGQASSPILWQPWARESLQRAKDTSRLVFVMVAMPQQPGFQELLAAFAADPGVVSTLNETSVPVLVDGDATREMSLWIADLSAEIKRPLQVPFFLWMTHDGNPVAWMPVSSSDPAGARKLFHQSHDMVLQIWKEDPQYVLRNSAMDNALRRDRIESRKVARSVSGKPADDLLRCLRQLTSLYDPLSRSFDETGGLFPSSAMELLAAASVRPGVPDDLRERCLVTLRELMKDLLPSPMFDPLDGGVFSTRFGRSWARPAFIRDCASQARVAVALLEAHRATGDPLALERALGVIAFAEGAYQTPEGLFAVGLGASPDPVQWMWNVEDVRRVLSPDDAAWWIENTGMKGLGNLPSESDPQREFFRSNSIGLARTIDQYAAARSQSPEEFLKFFNASKRKLLEARSLRSSRGHVDTTSHAGATLRMVSAYAAAYSVTGDVVFLTKAVDLLKRARAAFSVGSRLRIFSQEAPESLAAGRGFLYALAMQSALDVAAITADDAWLVWAEDLATTSAELFTGNGFLKECPDEAKLVDLPATDLVMLFDDSTAGLVSMAESRLAELGRPLVPSFSELATPLPVYATERPVLHTDLLQATLVRHFRLTVVSGGGLAPELDLAISRLPARTVQRRPARPDEQVPAGSVRILLPGGGSVVAASAAALRDAVLPTPTR
jgi:uncharacterized protein